MLIDKGVDLSGYAQGAGATLLFAGCCRLLQGRGNLIGLEQEKARERPGLLRMGFCKDRRS
jgi:hypothetical protein